MLPTLGISRSPNSESEESEPDCLMANEVDSDSDDDDEDIKVTDLKPELIAHDDLVALSKCLLILFISFLCQE